MNEIEAVKNQEKKNHFAKFLDRLKRWHHIDFDEETKRELNLTLAKNFEKADFDYCEKTLVEDDQKKFRISPADIYKICLKSKKERERQERIKKEIEDSKTLSVNRAGKEEVRKTVKKLGEALKNNLGKKESEEKTIKITLYEFYNHLTCKLDKIVAQENVPELDFVKACREKYYRKPHTVKKIFYKRVTKKELDKNGAVIGKYSTWQAVSSMCEGAVLHTVGYY